MEWPRVTIDAAMLASAIRVYARLKAHVGAVVVSDNRAGAVAQELSAGKRIFIGVPVFVALEMEFFKAVGRIETRASGRNCWRTGAHVGKVNEIMFICPVVCAVSLVRARLRLLFEL